MFKQRTAARWSAALAGCAAALLLGLSGTVSGQRLGTAQGYKLEDHFPEPNEKQVKSRLEGASAQMLEGNRLLLKEVKLQTYSPNGEPELLIKTPECLYEHAKKAVSSAGALRVETADGDFAIEGQGFSWQQTNSSLFISNQVRTVVKPEVMGSTPPGARSEESTPAGQGIGISSRSFNYTDTAEEGHYEGDVRMTGTNFTLSSERLTFKLPRAQRQLEKLVAEQNVAVDYELENERLHTTGERAIYTAAADTLLVTGRAAWETAPRDGGAERRRGRGDELLLDRNRKVFRTTGNGWLQLPGQSLGSSGLLPQLASAPTNTPPATNQVLEITSSVYEITTNYARFEDPVRVTQKAGDEARGTLTCRLMTASFSGSNQLQTLVADKDVVIQQDTNRLTGGHAVYTSSNSFLVVTENPAWQNGNRSGKGGWIGVNVKEEGMLVRSNASLRLPAGELGQLAMPTAGERPAAAEGFADIFSEEYTIKESGAVFRGGVYISHPQINWVCENLAVDFGSGEGGVSHITSQRAVRFDLRDSKGQMAHGVGDQAIYDHSTRPTTNDLVTLTGSPAFLTMSNSVSLQDTASVTNRVIIWDRLSNRFMTPGRYTIRVKTPGTNEVPLAGSKLMR